MCVCVCVCVKLSFVILSSVSADFCVDGTNLAKHIDQ